MDVDAAPDAAQATSPFDQFTNMTQFKTAPKHTLSQIASILGKETDNTLNKAALVALLQPDFQTHLAARKKQPKPKRSAPASSSANPSQDVQKRHCHVDGACSSREAGGARDQAWTALASHIDHTKSLLNAVRRQPHLLMRPRLSFILDAVDDLAAVPKLVPLLTNLPNSSSHVREHESRWLRDNRPIGNHADLLRELASGFCAACVNGSIFGNDGKIEVHKPRLVIAGVDAKVVECHPHPRYLTQVLLADQQSSAVHASLCTRLAARLDSAVRPGVVLQLHDYAVSVQGGVGDADPCECHVYIRDARVVHSPPNDDWVWGDTTAPSVYTLEHEKLGKWGRRVAVEFGSSSADDDDNARATVALPPETSAVPLPGAAIGGNGSGSGGSDDEGGSDGGDDPWQTGDVIIEEQLQPPYEPLCDYYGGQWPTPFPLCCDGRGCSVANMFFHRCVTLIHPPNQISDQTLKLIYKGVVPTAARDQKKWRRSALYYWFATEVWGAFGRRNRVKLPLCLVSKIREQNPNDLNTKYVGHKP